MSSPQDDKDLDDYLRGGSDLSRRYRALSQEEPPAALDRMILDQARAMGAGEASNVKPLPRRHVKRWMVPFGLAATVLLSFAIFRESGVQPELSAPAPATLSTAEVTEKQAEAAAVEPAQQREAESRVESDSRSPAVTLAFEVPPPPAQTIPPQIPAPAPAEASRNEIAEEQRTVARMRAAPAAAQSAAVADTASQEVPRQPQEWLEAIRTLRTQDVPAADRELERFLEAYPGYFEQNPTVPRP